MTTVTSLSWFTDRHRVLIGRVMVVAAVAFAVVSVIPYVRRDPARLYDEWIIHNSGGALLLALIGWLLVEARPRNRAAWLFPWMALLQSLNSFGNATLAWLDVVEAELIPFDELGVSGWIGHLLAAAAWIPGIAPMVTLALVWFPDGHLPSPRWRATEWLAGASIVGSTVAVGWATRPIDGMVGNSADSPLFAVSLVGLLVSVLLSLAGLIVRYRRSRGGERRRFRWIAWATGLSAVSFVAGNLIDLFVIGSSESPTFKAVALPTMVVFFGGYAIAIWRHQLFDIDLVISRTLIWGSLAAFIGAMYIGVVFGVGALIGRSSGEDAILSLIATALVAFLFQPVRLRLEHAANRLVFGPRASPYEVLAELSRRLARAESTNGLFDRMVTLLADGVGAESAVVWRLVAGQSDVLPDDEDVAERYEPLAVYPPSMPVAPRPAPIGPAADEELVPIERAGERLGALTMTKRRGEDLTPIERRLVEDLAGSAGLVLDRARLDADLAAKAAALALSRRRLVEAQTDERHRLQERLQSDTRLHLAALADRLDDASVYAVADGVEAIGAQVETLAAEIRLAIDEIDLLARGMYPPVLESQGLPAAIEVLAAGLPLPVEVRSSIPTRLDLNVEQAVYFTVGEALTNVVKHAEASAASVDLELVGERLRFEISDNGHGFRPGLGFVAGTGLAGLRDRIDTIGGTLSIDSETGRGTSVSGLVPADGRGAESVPTGLGALATLDRRA